MFFIYTLIKLQASSNQANLYVVFLEEIRNWLAVLLTPIVLLIIAFFITRRLSNRERKAADLKNERETLRDYFKQMSVFLTEKKLSYQRYQSPEVQAAKAITLSVLREFQLDGKKQVIQFLLDANLIQNKVVAILRKSKFYEIDLSYLFLGKAELSESKFHQVRLIATNLSKANLFGSEFIEAILNYANLSQSNCEKTTFNKATLKKADLSQSNFREAILEEAILEEANLEGIELTKAKLLKANLKNSYLRKAKLIKANLNNTNLIKADLRETILHKAELYDSKLNYALLEQADLSGAYLDGARLRNANLKKAILTNTSLVGTDLRGANLSGANLQGSILTDAQFRGSIYDTDTVFPKGFNPCQKRMRRNSSLTKFLKSLSLHNLIKLLKN